MDATFLIYKDEAYHGSLSIVTPVLKMLVPVLKMLVRGEWALRRGLVVIPFV